MNTTASKGFKPYIHKAIIVSMSLLYIFGPVHVAVNSLLHTIAHGLEMPDDIRSHQDVINHSSKVATHRSEDHKNSTEHHDHKVISFLDKILEGSDQSSDSSDAYVVTHKIDKHIHNNDYYPKNEALKVAPLEIRHCFSDTENSVCKGYLRGFRKPPQA
jgi:hypothetical protein